jgi:short-subunit dehydrogenase
LVRAVAERFGGIDVLLNNAGVASFGEFATSSEAVLRRVMELNFFAPVELIRLCQPHLAKSAELGAATGWRPAVVTVASICGKCGIPSFPEHCASKFAVTGLCQALRGEFARFDIDVSVVMPGLVRSDDLSRHLLRNEGRIHLDFAGAQPPEDVAAGVVRALERNPAEAPVGRVSRWVWFGKRASPRVMRWVMARKVRRFKETSG